jgi:hypothetical protein
MISRIVASLRTIGQSVTWHAPSALRLLRCSWRPMWSLEDDHRFVVAITVEMRLACGLYREL